MNHIDRLLKSERRDFALKILEIINEDKPLLKIEKFCSNICEE